MPNEIITIQLGNYSNYIGSHFWNIQESNFVFDPKNASSVADINNDVLFREGLNQQNQVTYTPRLLLFDLRDSLNALKEIGTLYETKEAQNSNVASWSGKIDVYKSKPCETSEYLKDIELEESEDKMETTEAVQEDKVYPNMDNQVKYWSDYLRMRFHPRTVQLINEYSYSNSDKEPFDLYHYGYNLSKNSTFTEDFENRLRVYAEECDNIQGFHFFVDSYNGFGGIAKNLLPIINEEFSKKSIFTLFSYPYSTEQTHESQMIKLINTSFTLDAILNETPDAIILPCSMVKSFPISKTQTKIDLPSFDYKVNLNYHTSAILASLIDCVSTPWRQRSQETSLSQIGDLLDVYKHKIACLKSIYPLEIEQNKYLFNYLQDHNLLDKANWFTPMCESSSPKTEENNNYLHSQIVCCKGIADDRVKNPRDDFYFKGIVPAHQILDTYCNELYSSARNKSFSLSTPLNVNYPYPDIYRPLTDESSMNKATQKKAKKTISLLTSLQINSAVSNMFESQYKNLEKCDIKQYNRYIDSGLEVDDFKDVTNNTRELFYLYNSKS